MKTSAFFETEKATRYLGTLCKHFGHKVPVGLEGAEGWVELPFARCDMVAQETGLSMVVTAGSKTELEKGAQVISSHLERFAFRENPTLTWHSDAA